MSFPTALRSLRTRNYRLFISGQLIVAQQMAAGAPAEETSIS